MLSHGIAQFGHVDMPARTAKIFVLYCRNFEEKMVTLANGHSTQVILTFRKSLGDENACFLLSLTAKISFTCVAIISDVNVISEMADF